MKTRFNPITKIVPLWRYELSVIKTDGLYVSRRVSCVDLGAATRAAYVFQGVVPGAVVGVMPRVSAVRDDDGEMVQDGYAS